MKLTRPKRRRLYMACYGLLGAVAIWLFWGPMPNGFQAKTATAAGAPLKTENRTDFGVIRVARVTLFRTYNPNTRSMISRQAHWEWSPLRVAISTVATVALLLMIPVAYRRKMRKDRLTGLCDECGYDLSGLQSGRCPECGEAVGAA